MGYTLVLGVGAQKSGTSWLHRALADHPQVTLSRLKEMHFWNEMFLPSDAELAHRTYSRWLLRLATRIAEGHVPKPFEVQTAKDLAERAGMKGDPAAYRRFFDRRIGAARVTGEITPAYARLGTAHFRMIRETHADVRPVFLMRDPVDRFWSAMRSEAQSAGTDPVDQARAKLDKPATLERGAYHRTAQALEEAFGAQGALLVYTEDLLAPGGLSQVCGFLGLDPQPTNAARRVNATQLEAPLPDDLARAIFAAHQDTYRWAAERAVPLPTAWQARLDRFG